MKIFYPIFILLILTTAVFAADTVAFDSTANFDGTCQLTSESDWTISKDITVSKFRILYNWAKDEKSVNIKVFHAGTKFTEFNATKGECIKGKDQWCNADYFVNKLFPKGEYTTLVGRAGQCLKPGGTGTVILFTNPETATVDSMPAINEPKPIVTPVTTQSPLPQVTPYPTQFYPDVPTPNVLPTAPINNTVNNAMNNDPLNTDPLSLTVPVKNAGCSCTNAIIYTALSSIVATALVLYLLNKKN